MMKRTRLMVSRRYRVVIPPDVRKQIGVNPGDILEAEVVRGKLTLTPTLEGGIAKSMRDISKGRSYGPFATHKDFLASLHTESAKIRKKPKGHAA